jgi:hypothetical protein
MFRSYDHHQAEIYTSEMASHVNFRCIYFHLKMVVRPKQAADNLNKIVNNYWNRVALDGNPWTWSNTRNRMQRTKFHTFRCSPPPPPFWVELNWTKRPDTCPRLAIIIAVCMSHRGQAEEPSDPWVGLSSFVKNSNSHWAMIQNSRRHKDTPATRIPTEVTPRFRVWAGCITVSVFL